MTNLAGNIQKSLGDTYGSSNAKMGYVGLITALIIIQIV
jgi:hypothetical protein